jgi:hypothetical protein
MGANLGHQDRLVAPTLQCVPQTRLTFALMILPGVIEKIHTGIEGSGHNFGRFLLVFGRPQVVAPHPQRRDGDARLA